MTENKYCKVFGKEALKNSWQYTINSSKEITFYNYFKPFMKLIKCIICITLIKINPEWEE